MSTLKSLKLRIKSVKSTKKITQAMKVVSGAKLRNAERRLKSSFPYSNSMKEMINNLVSCVDLSDENINPKLVKLLSEKADNNKHLLIVTSSDRGLCGSFNSSIIKHTKKRIAELTSLGKQFEIITVGSKAYDLLKGQFSQKIIHRFDGLSKKPVKFADIVPIADKVIEDFLHDHFDHVEIVYNKFKTALSQEVKFETILPVPSEKNSNSASNNIAFEPDQNTILESLIIKNIRTRIYHAMLENSASEQGARMTAMDNATRNAGEMINDLTLQYNRTRQANITKELIEIISGAEAI